MLLLLATYYCCIIHQLLWFMFRGVFTVGVAITDGAGFALADTLTDYSYINARGGNDNGVQLARCLTGLGPRSSNNGVLGGWYFNGNKIPNSATCDATIQPRPGSVTAGIININQCGAFTTAAEGVYTCALMNSAMINESIRLGVYFSGRSESLDLYIL